MIKAIIRSIARAAGFRRAFRPAPVIRFRPYALR